MSVASGIISCDKTVSYGQILRFNTITYANVWKRRHKLGFDEIVGQHDLVLLLHAHAHVHVPDGIIILDHSEGDVRL